MDIGDLDHTLLLGSTHMSKSKQEWRVWHSAAPLSFLFLLKPGMVDGYLVLFVVKILTLLVIVTWYCSSILFVVEILTLLIIACPLYLLLIVFLALILFLLKFNVYSLISLNVVIRI